MIHFFSEIIAGGSLYEKKLICIGDSITHGTYTAIGESAPLSVAHPNFSELLVKKLSFDHLTNYGTNGISYSSLSSVRSESALTRTCSDFDNGDIIIIAAGTNDYGTNVPLGRQEDTTDISFFGAADEVFGCLTTKNPNGIIFVVLPIPRQESGKNTLGFTLDDYRNALLIKAEKYHLPVIDGRLLQIDPCDAGQRADYMPDGTHPNESGHKMYAEFLYLEIKKHLPNMQMWEKNNTKTSKSITYTYTFHHHEATVIVPEHPNGEWIWKTEFLYAFDQAERDLLKEGYTRVYYSISDRYGSPRSVRYMHAFYQHVIKKFELKSKCHLFGFSRGGLYAVNFALFYPECVASIYLDAPVLDMKSWPLENTVEQVQMFAEYALDKDTLFHFHENPVDNLNELFSLEIPVLLIAGVKDSLVSFQDNAAVMISYCQEHKLPLAYILKPDCDHHPHSLEDPSPILEFVKTSRNW